MKYLVIVESPNKVKTIQKYLGNDYEVKASVGHIVKMLTNGEQNLGINFQNWEPNYKIEPSKKHIVDELKKDAKKANIVYIATDPDREGEAIGDNLVEFLDIKNKYKRIKYNEITKEAILASINAPTMIDENLVKAQKSRRMLDRIIGFRLTNLMTKKMSNYPEKPTAGRVQSIALKLVVDRENEIRNFVPTYYSTIEAKINDNISATYYNPNGEFDNKEWISKNKVNGIMKELNGPLVVCDIKISNKSDAKVSPLKQSVLYKKADMSSRSVQSSAQKLYEGFGDGGLISYPRTDSTRLSENFLVRAREFIANKYGKEYVANDIKGFSGDQDAHEAIRPTDITLDPEMAKNKYNLSTYDYKVYSIIWHTTMRAIMSVPKREIIRYELTNNNHNFKLSSSKITFDGYLILAPKDQIKEIPKYNVNDLIDVKEYVSIDHETKPPARYTDGTLIEKLDDIKVGRPSTFATTVEKILDRKFVVKEGNSLKSTEFGEAVIHKLIEGFPNEITEDYTARVEADLDLIADGEIDYKHLMQSFWERFDDSFKTAESTLEKTILLDRFVGEECPNCGSPLIYKTAKKTKEEFISCSRWPECTYSRSTKNKPKRFGFLKKSLPKNNN
ncbi:MAG: type I DNA topoisomerase [Mycoplasma sp.]|nr:type I DNA topoisomerase [Mycoplasma sp.]